MRPYLPFFQMNFCYLDDSQNGLYHFWDIRLTKNKIKNCENAKDEVNTHSLNSYEFHNVFENKLWLFERISVWLCAFRPVQEKTIWCVLGFHLIWMWAKTLPQWPLNVFQCVWQCVFKSSESFETSGHRIMAHSTLSFCEQEKEPFIEGQNR